MHSSRNALLLHRLEAEQTRRDNQNRLGKYAPYPKQVEFHAAGVGHRERLLMAGNQLGKTIAGGYELAMHLTGIYPDDWPGRRWDRPTRWWASGVTGESTRDNPQRILLGLPGEFGSGAIPAHKLRKVTPGRGVPDLVDTIRVDHISGGVSRCALKSYEKGRQKWQGETLDGIWYDEEPPLDIYSEGLTRTNATGGCVFVTFTPLLGVSDVVARFLMEKPIGTHTTTMTIDDAGHYTDEQRAAIVAAYPAHEREARARGVPVLGSGRVFPVTEESITCEPFDIPDSWPQLGAMDFGWDHPTAAVRGAHDRDGDVIYITQTYREREKPIHTHAAALRAWSPKLLWAWPHDGLQHDKGSGEQLAEQYRDHGLGMLAERAQFDDGTSGVEAGIAEMLDRMETGRLKIFRTLPLWFEEFRLYHRKDGVIVKERDDLMAATRYLHMMLRFAKTLKPRIKRAVGEGYRGEGAWMR